MLDKFAKLEEIINKQLEKLMLLIKSILIKLYPQKLKNFVSRLKTKLLLFITNTKARFFGKLQALKKSILSTKDKTQNKINTVKQYPYKDKIKKSSASSITFLKTTPLKKYIEILENFLSPYTKKINNFFTRFSRSQYSIAVTALVMIVGGLTGVIYSSKNIYDTENPYRAPASVQEYDEKPEYADYNKKTLKIFNIKIPVYAETVTSMDAVTVDFSIRTSTKFAKIYLEDYEYKLKDYFFTHVEVMVSEFTLKEEGKEVLKEKIIEELNAFLIKNDVEGEIVDINILYMVGS